MECPATTYPPARVVTCQCGYGWVRLRRSDSDISHRRVSLPRHRASPTGGRQSRSVAQQTGHAFRVSRECAGPHARDRTASGVAGGGACERGRIIPGMGTARGSVPRPRTTLFVGGPRYDDSIHDREYGALVDAREQAFAAMSAGPRCRSEARVVRAGIGASRQSDACPAPHTARPHRRVGHDHAGDRPDVRHPRRRTSDVTRLFVTTPRMVRMAGLVARGVHVARSLDRRHRYTEALRYRGRLVVTDTRPMDARSDGRETDRRADRAFRSSLRPANTYQRRKFGPTDTAELCFSAKTVGPLRRWQEGSGAIKLSQHDQRPCEGGAVMAIDTSRCAQNPTHARGQMRCARGRLRGTGAAVAGRQA